MIQSHEAYVLTWSQNTLDGTWTLQFVMLPTTPSCIRQGALIYGSFNICVYHWSRPKEVERCADGVEGGKSRPPV